MLTCKRCSYDWQPRSTEKPKQCPRCKSYAWVSPSRHRYIYALQHPVNKEFFYVGGSINPAQRVSEHLTGASNGPTMRRYISTLKAAGLTARLVILERAPFDIAIEREQHWIDTLKAQGEPLLNKKPAEESRWLLNRTTEQKP